MKQKFLINLFLVIGLNLLIKPFYIIGIDAEVQNRVGEAIYGNYFSLLNFSFLLNILLDFGLSNYNTRNIASNPKLIKEQFYKILSLRLILFLVYAIFTGVAAFTIGYEGNELYLLGILAVNQFLVAVVQFGRSNFSGLHMFATDSVMSVLDRGLLIIFCSILLWTNFAGGAMKIEWFVYAQTLSYGIAALIAVILLIKKAGPLALDFKREFSFSILRESFPYALLILLMMAYNRIDTVMIERMLHNGDEQAGVYAQGFRFLDAANMFALLFAGLLLPIFSRLIAQKKSVEKICELAFRILAGTAIIVSLTCYFFSWEIISWRYPGYAEDSEVTFSFLMLCFIPVSISYVFGTLLTANGSLRYLNYIALSGLIINVGLNCYFIPAGQALGASMVALITQWATVIVLVIVAYRIFKLKINFKMYAALTGLVLLMIGMQMVFIRLVEISKLAEFVVLSGSAIIFAFVTGIFKISDFSVLIRKSQEEKPVES